MNKENKKDLIIFIVLILLILGVFLINIFRNRKISNIDRKTIFINNMSYDVVYNKGNNLFFKCIDLLKGDALTYEKDNNERIKIYSINKEDYKKITNFSLIATSLSSSEISKYIDYKNILLYENNYYIKNINNKIDSNYIGSILNISSYNEKYVIFESYNYYCDNYEYVGDLIKEPSCNYKKEKSTFKVVFENNNLLLDNIDNIKDILK